MMFDGLGLGQKWSRLLAIGTDVPTLIGTEFAQMK
jgi:hypothetical protein